MRAPYHCATKPTPMYRDRISLLNPLRVTSRIFQEGARFFEHEVKSTRLYFPPKRFHPQTNSTWLGSRHHPSSIVVFLQHRFFWSQTTLVIAADANHDFLEKKFFSSSQRACTRPFFIATIYLFMIIYGLKMISRKISCLSGIDRNVRMSHILLFHLRVFQRVTDFWQRSPVQ